MPQPPRRDAHRRSLPASPRMLVGRHGEELAAMWYLAAGYEVVARNWRCREGEIDLVCRTGRTIVFCEVKARRSSRFGTPAEAVTPAKRRRIRRLAGRWLHEHAEHGTDVRFDVRFDVACVVGERVEVIFAAW